MRFGIKERHLLLGRWCIIDLPEIEAKPYLKRLSQEGIKKAQRPAVHLALTVPLEFIPAGMGGHLVMNLDGDQDPLIVTLAPAEDGQASLEILSPRPLLGEEHEQETSIHLINRVRELLKFLPDDLPQAKLRTGQFPAYYGRAGLLDRLRYPGACLESSNFYREGHAILVGRGNYLGSNLNGALKDGQDLALWILNRGRH
jgi:hypothetical protein